MTAPAETVIVAGLIVPVNVLVSVPVIAGVIVFHKRIVYVIASALATVKNTTAIV
jgi:hypothetical protein